VFGLSFRLVGLALLTLGLVQRWGEVVPRWIPLVGGKPVPPLAAVIPAGTGAVALMLLWASTFSNIGEIWAVYSLDGAERVFMMACYLPLLLWGPLLAAVTVAYHRRHRRASVADQGAASPRHAAPPALPERPDDVVTTGALEGAPPRLTCWLMPRTTLRRRSASSMDGWKSTGVIVLEKSVPALDPRRRSAIDVSGTRGRWPALVGVAIFAVIVIGCGGGPTRSCRQSSGVELCLIDDGPAHKLTGKGFQAESEVRVSVEDDAGPTEPVAQGMPPVRADAHGAFPAGGVLSVVEGPVPQRVTARGTASDGSAVEIRFTIPARAG